MTTYFVFTIFWVWIFVKNVELKRACLWSIQVWLLLPRPYFLKLKNFCQYLESNTFGYCVKFNRALPKYSNVRNWRYFICTVFESGILWNFWCFWIATDVVFVVFEVFEWNCWLFSTRLSHGVYITRLLLWWRRT